MKRIIIDKELTDKVKQLRIGTLEASVKIKRSPQELVDMMNLEAEKISRHEVLEDIARIPAVYHTREAYKALGKKPARYRVSSEALHRRIVQEKGLYFINNLVDINNLISIRSGFGICLYDREKIEGDMNFRIARKGETYRGIGKYDLNLENLPVFADDLGPFGSPTSDSERTMITNQTQRISFHIIAFQLDIDLQPWLQQAQELMLRFADGGDFELGLSAG